MVKSEDVCFLPIIPIYVPAWGLPGEEEGGGGMVGFGIDWYIIQRIVFYFLFFGH